MLKMDLHVSSCRSVDSSHVHRRSAHHITTVAVQRLRRGHGSAAREVYSSVPQIAVQHKQESWVDEGVYKGHVQGYLVRDGIAGQSRLYQGECEQGTPEQDIGGQNDSKAFHPPDTCGKGISQKGMVA